MIDWLKRCRREDTKYAERRVWYSRCKTYKVVEIHIRYGRGDDEKGQALGYPITYEARINREDTWHLLSEHTKHGPAVSALEYFAKHGKKKPKRTKSSKAIKRQKAKRKAKREKR